MDETYLYNWVNKQLNAGIPKAEIVNNVLNYTKLSREEAENYVNDPLYRQNFKLSHNEARGSEQEPTENDIISKLSGIENELKAVNKKLGSIYWLGFSVFFGLVTGWLIADILGC
ncbi:MAG: hypothetical protein JRJ00_07645 [Deltaproteobacteria bacterium]|nr:hypothetical protein [Deltaproteobacteria bacterium]